MAKAKPLFSSAIVEPPQVSVLPVQSSLGDEAGNIFVTDDNRGAAPSGRGKGPNVWLKWLSANQLKIVYDRRAQTFEMKEQFEGISITYQAK